MTAENGHAGPSMLADLIAELERGGGGRPAEIGRGLGGGRRETAVVAALAEPFSDGVVGDNSQVGPWWVA